MSEKAHLYMILGMSSNNVIECIIIEGYDTNDAHYYIMENYSQFSDNYPFIHKTLSHLIDVYKKQYKMDPNLANFKDLVDNSDELGKNFIKIIECSQKMIVNACSYYQNNKKTVALKPSNTVTNTKPVTIGIKDLLASQSIQTETSTTQPIVKPQIQIKTKTEIRPKIGISLKKTTI